MAGVSIMAGRIKVPENVFVIQDDLSCFGIRKVHVMSLQAINPMDYLIHVPDVAAEFISYGRWKDEAGMMHLYIAWNSRDFITIPGLGTGLLWYQGKGKRVREVIEDAVLYTRQECQVDEMDVFLRVVKSKWPSKCLVGEKEVELKGDERIPDRYVFVRICE